MGGAGCVNPGDSSVNLNSDVWCQNIKCRIDFGTLYTDNLKPETLGFWSILFKNVLQRQKFLENVEKYTKKNSMLRLTISNVVFEVPNTAVSSVMLDPRDKRGRGGSRVRGSDRGASGDTEQGFQMRGLGV